MCLRRSVRRVVVAAVAVFLLLVAAAAAVSRRWPFLFVVLCVKVN